MDDPHLGIADLQVGLPFISVVGRGRVDCSFPFFLFACRMARGEEETSTN